jgi:hypothetical protein
VAAHRRGFCEIEVFEDLPYGRVLGSVSTHTINMLGKKASDICCTRRWRWP